MVEKDPKRSLTKSEKLELLYACKFQCQGKHCKNKNLVAGGYDFHHIKRHADGGLTTRYQHLVLCKECHKREHTVEEQGFESSIGSVWNGLRQWQKDAIKRFDENDDSNEKLFVLEAAPGAGKSMFAACASRVYLDKHVNVNHVICLAPWIPIITSMKKTFGRLELEIRDKFHYDRSRGHLQAMPLQDITLDTYQGFCNHLTAEVLENWCTQKNFKFMLILDEVHHMNVTKGSWGVFGERIAELASKILVMSGTYFRSDSQPISFLEYEAGRPKTHYSISYSECVRNRYVRQVAFRYINPTLEIYSLDKQASKKYQLSNAPMASGKISRQVFDEVLDPQGPHVAHLIEEAWSQLQGMRRKWPDAACLVVCRPGSDGSDQRHVHAIAKRIESLTGQSVETVTSDDAASRGRIDAFTRGNDPFLCAIRMVSEGVDIPRIRMVLFVSYTDSEMLFRQIAGRALRYIPGKEDDTAALVVMPKFPKMHKFAERFEAEADVELNVSTNTQPPKVCEECNCSPCTCGKQSSLCMACNSEPCKCYTIIESIAVGGGGLISESMVREENVQAAKIITERFSQHQHANVIQLADAIQKGKEITISGVNQDLEDSKNLCIRNINRKVQQIAKYAYASDYSLAWFKEVHETTGSNINEIRSTWRLSDIEALYDRLKLRLVEVIND